MSLVKLQRCFIFSPDTQSFIQKQEAEKASEETEDNRSFFQKYVSKINHYDVIHYVSFPLVVVYADWICGLPVFSWFSRRGSYWRRRRGRGTVTPVVSQKIINMIIDYITYNNY